MLDQETKKRINDLRDTLVGKVPDPKSQVEQIMIALIFKFMNDMDKESADLGGKASFFVDEFEKFSWSNMFDPRVSGDELVELYSDAVESMDDNPNIPQIFRDIFKNAFIPYKDPETLRLFLKQINEFEYSKDSEQLGDAFEHILNSLSSQGDAGQFRTPRHIIDFIVEIVNPKKDETVLDPASGTSGFLISAFKHIVNSNSEKSSGDLLSATERKKIMENINGYDISPDMVRIGLANMYLHGFPEPNVVEYDALTSEDRWNEYYDVILANPPFMTPKGGIRPHNKFGLKSNRAEVLFVDYILTHLKPKGRAGIIVPEGIIFQSGKAYKELRKKLVENGLVGVISLPSGVFNPYSGVKTSILIIDKSKSNEEIYFSKIINDGFSLSAQRNQIDLNDLPQILNDINSGTFELVQRVSLEKIIKSEYSLSIGSYLEINSLSSNYDLVELSKLISIDNGYAFKSSNYTQSGFRVVRIKNVFENNFKDDDPKFHEKLEEPLHKKFVLNQNDILISLTGNVGRVCVIDEKYLPAYLNQRVGRIKKTSKEIDNKYLLNILNSENFLKFCEETAKGAAQPNLSTKDIYKYKIPLPPLDVQQEIVDEIEQYQKVVDGARQVIDSYQISIEPEDDWKPIELASVSTITDGSHYSPEIISNGYPYITVKDINKFGEIDFENCKKIAEKDYKDLVKNKCKPNKNDILFSKDGTVGKTSFIDFEENFVVLSSLAIITPDNDYVEPKFLYYTLSSNKFISAAIGGMSGSAIRRIVLKDLKKIKIYIPSIEIQKEKVKKIEEFENILKGNRYLLAETKSLIEKKISKLYN